jgi:hypothetical protein
MDVGGRADGCLPHAVGESLTGGDKKAAMGGTGRRAQREGHREKGTGRRE